VLIFYLPARRPPSQIEATHLAGKQPRRRSDFKLRKRAVYNGVKPMRLTLGESPSTPARAAPFRFRDQMCLWQPPRLVLQKLAALSALRQRLLRVRQQPHRRPGSTTHCRTAGICGEVFPKATDQKLPGFFKSHQCRFRKCRKTN
jgi:hypothetical protein